MFKNSMKLLFANFGTVWKLMVYYLIVSGVIVGLVAPVWGALSAHFNPELASAELLQSAMSINVASNLPVILVELYEGLIVLFAGIISLFTSNPLLAVYICFLVFYLI